MEKQSIKILIAGRSYPLSIEREEEEIVRLAVKGINEKMVQYKTAYHFREDQDVLAIILLQQMVQSLREKREDRAGRLQAGIEELDRQMDEYLNRK